MHINQEPLTGKLFSSMEQNQGGIFWQSVSSPAFSTVGLDFPKEGWVVGTQVKLYAEVAPEKKAWGTNSVGVPTVSEAKKFLCTTPLILAQNAITLFKNITNKLWKCRQCIKTFKNPNADGGLMKFRGLLPPSTPLVLSLAICKSPYPLPANFTSKSRILYIMTYCSCHVHNWTPKLLLQFCFKLLLLESMASTSENFDFSVVLGESYLQH